MLQPLGTVQYLVYKEENECRYLSFGNKCVVTLMFNVVKLLYWKYWIADRFILCTHLFPEKLRIIWFTMENALLITANNLL
jgi:hypothetical protein